MEFRKYNGEQILNVFDYVKDTVTNDPTINVAIGCDSKQLRYKTQYAITVVLHSDFHNNGAHVVFHRFKLDKIKNRFVRLWKECEYILEVADEMHKHLQEIEYKRYKRSNEYYKLVEVHLDLNPNALFDSNKVYEPAYSMFRGMGYETVVKPYAAASSSAADMLCK